MRIPPFARRVVDPLTSRVRIPILGGVNRGMRWSLASAGHGYGTGRRAARQMGLLSDLMERGDVIWDVGAHHGYMTLAAARHTGPLGAVHAFEPSASNRERLTRHVEWNDLRNVTIHAFALSDHEGEMRFGGGGSSKTFALGGGEERVAVTTGAMLIERGVCPAPHLVKVDVEGAEGDLLRGALPAFRGTARLLVGVHSREAHASCMQALRSAGYEVRPSRALATALANVDAPWPGDPDLYAIGPDSQRRKRDEVALERWAF
jgi:FkbM family methyltransferase